VFISAGLPQDFIAQIPAAIDHSHGGDRLVVRAVGDSMNVR
jgi:hypothetical protein